MDLPDFEQFALETPLFKEYSLDTVNKEGELSSYLNVIRFPNNPMDVYCVDCKKASTFHRSDRFQLYFNEQEFGKLEIQDDRMLMVELTCTRNDNHKLYFFFRIRNLVISKIGQYQSAADLQIRNIKKYQKLLGNERFKEL